MELYLMKIKDNVDCDDRYKKNNIYYTKKDYENRKSYNTSYMNVRFSGLQLIKVVNVSDDIPIPFRSYEELKELYPSSFGDIYCRASFISAMKEIFRDKRVSLRTLNINDFYINSYKISLDMLNIDRFCNSIMRI